MGRKNSPVRRKKHLRVATPLKWAGGWPEKPLPCQGVHITPEKLHSTLSWGRLSEAGNQQKKQKTNKLKQKNDGKRAQKKCADQGRSSQKARHRGSGMFKPGEGADCRESYSDPGLPYDRRAAQRQVTPQNPIEGGARD